MSGATNAQCLLQEIFDNLQDSPKRNGLKKVLYTEVCVLWQCNFFECALSHRLYQLNFRTGTIHELTKFCARRHCWKIIKIFRKCVKQFFCINLKESSIEIWRVLIEIALCVMQ